MTKIRQRTIAGLRVGDAFEVVRTFTEKDTVDFARISRDYNPIHFDDRFAAVKRMNGRICHGLLVAGLITEIGGQIGWLASGMQFEFKKPVYLDDEITCTLKIVEVSRRTIATIAVEILNAKSELISSGTVKSMRASVSG